MEIKPEICSRCGADTRNDRAAGLTYCAACGSALAAGPAPAEANPSDSADIDDVADRTRWRRCFWLAFFVTPIAPIVAGAGANFLYRTFPNMGDKLGLLLGFYSVIGTFAAGVVSSSYCLLRIRNETLSRRDTIVQLVFQSIGMAVIYVAVFFAGCGVLSVFLR